MSNGAEPQTDITKEGKNRNVEFGSEDKINFYGLEEKSKFIAYKGNSIAYGHDAGTGGINSEANQSSSSEQLLQMHQNVVVIKELLTAMLEQLNKIRNVTKETRADMARLRINLPTTKRQGIRAMQDVIERLNKVTKEIDASYDNFCTKVYGRLCLLLLNYDCLVVYK